MSPKGNTLKLCNPVAGRQVYFLLMYSTEKYARNAQYPENPGADLISWSITVCGMYT
jgi:hypothetical protein